MSMSNLNNAEIDEVFTIACRNRFVPSNRVKPLCAQAKRVLDLEEKLSASANEAFDYLITIQKLEAETKAAENRFVALTEAFDRYAQHDTYCKVNNGHGWVCTCGRDDVLQEIK